MVRPRVLKTAAHSVEPRTIRSMYASVRLPFQSAIVDFQSPKRRASSIQGTMDLVQKRSTRAMRDSAGALVVQQKSMEMRITLESMNDSDAN